MEEKTVQRTFDLDGRRTFQRGDVLYRFKFDLANGMISKDLFEVVDVYGCRVKAACMDEKKSKTFAQGVYFNPEVELGQIKTKGTAKYIMLAEDDSQKAAMLVLEFLKARLEEYEERAKRTAEWVDILEKLLKGEDGDGK